MGKLLLRHGCACVCGTWVDGCVSLTFKQQMAHGAFKPAPRGVGATLQGQSSLPSSGGKEMPLSLCVRGVVELEWMESLLS